MRQVVQIVLVFILYVLAHAFLHEFSPADIVCIAIDDIALPTYDADV